LLVAAKSRKRSRPLRSACDSPQQPGEVVRRSRSSALTLFPLRQVWRLDAGSTLQALATIPAIIWGAFLGIRLTFKGFKATVAVLDESRGTGVDPGLAIAAS